MTISRSILERETQSQTFTFGGAGAPGFVGIAQGGAPLNQIGLSVETSASVAGNLIVGGVVTLSPAAIAALPFATPWLFGVGPPAPGLGVDGKTYYDTFSGQVYEKSGGVWVPAFVISGSGAPIGADYLVLTSNAQLTNERAFSSSATVAINIAIPGQFSLDRVALTGDVTAPLGSNVMTIAAGVVTNAQLAAMQPGTIKGNNTLGVASPSDLTAAQTKTLLNIGAADVAGLASIASSGSAFDLTSGTVDPLRLPGLTGDVTSVAGTNVTTIPASSIALAKLAPISANAVVARSAATSGSPGEVVLGPTQLFGRGSTGDLAPIVLGSNLNMAGTTLNAISPASGAPTGAQYLVAVADATLTAERVAQSTTSIIFDAATVGQFSFQRAALNGDVIASQDSNSTFIVGSAVTNTKLANMPANTFKGNNTGASAAPLDLTAAQVKTALAITGADVSGLATIATTGSANDLVSGTIPVAVMPALSGDVTSPAGSTVTTIAAGVVTNAKLATMPANTFKGNNTGVAGTPIDLTPAQVKATLAITTADITGLAPIAASGSASDLSAGTVPAARMPALSGAITSTAGSTVTTLSAAAVSYANIQNASANTVITRASPSAGVLGETALGASQLLGRGTAGDVTAITIGANLTMTGTTLSGPAGGAPIGAEYLVVSPDPSLTNERSFASSTTISFNVSTPGQFSLERLALTGDVVAGQNLNATTIQPGVVTNAKLASMPANTFKGNDTGASANPVDLTTAQVKAALAITPADVSGLATIATSGSASDLVAGTVPAARMPALSGDVTTAAGSTVTTVADGVVTNAKLATMPAGTFKGNTTGAAAAPTDLTAAQLKTALAITAGDVSGLAAIATSGSASDLATGTLSAARLPAFTGDVTTSAGSSVTTISNSAVTNAKLANMAANTVKVNNTAASAVPVDLAIGASQVLGRGTVGDIVALTLGSGFTFTGSTVTVSPGPTGAPVGAGYLVTTADPTLTNESVVVSSGSILVNTSVAGQVSFDRAALNGDVVTTGSSNATTIPAGTVVNSKLAAMPANTIKGNNTGASAQALDLTAAQVKTMLAIASADVSGLATVATSGSASDLATGTLPAARASAYTGDVTSGPNATVNTIAPNVVTNAKLAQAPANTFKGNNTGATANVTDLTPAQVKTALAITATDVAGLASVATSGSAADLSAGTLSAARLPAFTGDVTTTAGSSATTIAAGVVTNAKLANMPANTVKVNNTAAAGPPVDLALAANQLVGMGSTGNVAPITLGANLSMTGAVLNGAGSLTLSDTATAGGTVNNYAPAGIATASDVLISPTGVPNVLQITGVTTGAANRSLRLINNSIDYLLILPPESALSVAANRFGMIDTIFLFPGDSVRLIYDATASRWNLFVYPRVSQTRSNYEIKEDFEGRVSSATAGQVGTFSTIAAGVGAAVAASVNGVTATLKAFGEVSLTTGTVATNSADVLVSTLDSFNPALGVAMSLSRVNAGAALSTAAERFALSTGWLDTPASQESVDGAYWYYNDLDSANWELVNANNSVRTKTISTLVAAINAYVWLGVWCNTAWTRCDGFHSTDGKVWTLLTGAATNMPVAGRTFNLGTKMVKSVGLTSRIGFVDLMKADYLATGR